MNDPFQPGYQFGSDKFKLTVARRHNRILLLTKSKPGWTGWEVVILQYHKPVTLPDGTHSPARLAIPPTADWGMHGWSYCSERDALARFTALAERRAGANGPFSQLGITQDRP